MSAQILSVKYDENNLPYIGVGDHKIRLESEQPTEAVLEKARNELREVPEITGPAIAELRELLKGNYLVFLYFLPFSSFFGNRKNLVHIVWPFQINQFDLRHFAAVNLVIWEVPNSKTNHTGFMRERCNISLPIFIVYTFANDVRPKTNIFFPINKMNHLVSSCRGLRPKSHVSSEF